MASPTTSRTLTTSLQRWGEFLTGGHVAHALSNRIARQPTLAPAAAVAAVATRPSSRLPVALPLPELRHPLKPAAGAPDDCVRPGSVGSPAPQSAPPNLPYGAR